MNYYELLKKPDTYLVMGENNKQIDVTIEFKIKDECLIPSIQTNQRVTSVILKWKQKITNQSTLYCGDHFERGYGDLHWGALQPTRKMFWYFLTSNEVINKGYGVKTSPNAACMWYVDHEYVTLEMDTRSGSEGVNLKGRKLELCEIIEYASVEDIQTVHRQFCQRMCAVPQLPKEKVYGANTWYNTYGKGLSESLVLQYTDVLVEIAKAETIKPYMVIDDGWQEASNFCEVLNGVTINGGPWLPNRAFTDMLELANQIKAKGAKPGIWVRPLLTTKKSEDEAHILRTVSSPIKDEYVLDPTHPEVLKQVAKDMHRIAIEWGYQLIKHDFTTFDVYGQWGFSMSQSSINSGLQASNVSIKFYDDSLTTIEAIKNLYHVIKSSVGDDCIIMGCNTISHLSAGVFEVSRTGDDTSGYEFSRVRQMGVNTMAFRLAQHNRFYSADADCIGIKVDAIDWRQNREWLNLLAYSGTPLFFSADFDALTDKVKKDLAKGIHINLNAQPDHVNPIDWQYKTYPEMWQTSDGMKTFNWYQESNMN